MNCTIANGAVANHTLARFFSSQARATGDKRPGKRARHWLVLPLLAALVCGPAASAWANVNPEPPAPVSQTVLATPSSDSAPAGQESYASREAAAKNLESFKGGETVVVIGGTTLLIILVVLLIVVI